MMNGQRNFRGRTIVRGLVQTVMLVFLVAAFQMASGPAVAGDDACSETSLYARKACYNSANEAYNLALGKCENVAENKEDACEAKAREDLKSAFEECNDQFDARQDVCEQVGPGPYLPTGITPSTFRGNPVISDNYFPLIPGKTYTYKSVSSNGEIDETIVVKVKDQTRKILGVTCRVVQDTVYEGNAMVKKIEDTTDWYAIKQNGDVWYFGEIAQNFNEEGILENIDGSWTAGVEEAKPGIIMYARPGDHIGETYRQEFALGEAEDVATIIGRVNDLPSLPEGFVLPLGVRGPYLHTQDFSALEPGVVEDKYYAKGVGNVLIVKPDGTIEVLVSIRP
jgi:hypothetical protein